MTPAWELAIWTSLLFDVVPKLLYPIAGWLADAKLGRYRVMRYSLWIICVGNILLIMASIVRYLLLPKNVIEYMLPVFVLVYVINAVGIAGYHVNVIPFGIDQMEGASGEQITSFLHWYYWTRNINFGVFVQLAVQLLPDYCIEEGGTFERQQRYELYVLLVQMLFLTATLCLDFLFSSKLHKDVKIHNPVKKVKDISTFILKHNRQVGYRKAYTYTYDTPPARSDFAKKSYGGPFEDDEVEEVTSFWRIVLFLMSVGFAVFLIQTGYSTYSMFGEHMKSRIGFLPDCTSRSIFVNSISILSYSLSVPIFEFLIYPFVRNYVPRTMVRIGVGMAISLVGLSSLLAIDAVGHSATGPQDVCMFYSSSWSSDNTIPVNFYVLVPVLFVMAVGEMLVYISVFEFICAQAPYGMRGLIIGLSFMINSISVGLLSMLMMMFAAGYKAQHSEETASTVPGYTGISTGLSCGTSYLIAVVCIGCVGLLLYVVTAKCYRQRQRGGQRDENQYTTLEDHYERQREMEMRRKREREKRRNRFTSIL